MKRKHRKRLKIALSVFAVVVVLMVIVYKSPVGENLLRNYISSKLSLIKRFEIEEFNYKWNSFSLVLKKGSNYIYVYGDLFPFDATYEANFKNLEEINSNFRGELQSKGVIKYKGESLINGNALFANGYGDLNLTCNDDCKGNFKGSDFDLQSLFYMVKITFPYLKGITDLGINFNKKRFYVFYDFNGEVKYKNLFFKNVNVKGKGIVNKRDDFSLLANVKHKFFEGNLTLVNKNSFKYKGNAWVYMRILQPIILYPINVKEFIKFSYDQSSGVLKFFATDFSGYNIKDEIDLQLNKLSLKRFFKIIGIPPLAKGKINGNITIKYIGSFDLISNDFSVIKNRVISYIERKIGRKISSLKVAFLKGHFDRKKVVFDFLSKDNNLLLSIQQGVYYYSGDRKFIIEVINNKIKYVFFVKNNSIKLISKKKSYELKEKILVY